MTGRRRLILGLGVVSVCAAAALVIWKTAGLGGGAPPSGSTRGNAAAKPAPEGFDQVLEVLAGGGEAAGIERAIACLDTAARVRRSLAGDQRAALLAALERGSPAGMPEGSWCHLFNSACNALGAGQAGGDEGLLNLLERVAADDPRLVMRLYALQHIGRHYPAAAPANRQRLRALVQRLLADPASQTAGTALVLWREWEKAAGQGEISTAETSRAIVADAGRPVDVRVTALHAVGDDPAMLDLARGLAPDRTQPLILRKVALNLIGRHGEAEDLAVLRRCSGESPRLAQAGEPAARALEERIAGRIRPVLMPYQ